MKVERDIVVSNEHGLHARPAMQLVELANSFQCDLTLRKLNGPEGSGEGADPVDAKSVMQVITLAAVQGTRLRLTGEGSDAQQAIDAIATLFLERFGEDE